MRFQPEIESKIRASLSPLHLELVNESHMHSVPAGSETHFKVVIVSESFAGKTLVVRQRMVYELLSEQMRGGVHALTMKTLTPAEWEASGREVDLTSPKCLGGSKK